MYPVAYRADHVERQSRLITFFRYPIMIPWLLVGLLWGLGALVAVIVAWFAVVFTGRYPQGLYDFVAKALRYSTRVNSFYYLMTDRFPPFDGDEHPEYPIRLDVGPPLEQYSRWKAALRLVLMIPVYVLVYLLSLLIGIVVVLSWLVIVITGKHPKGLFDVLKLGLGYTHRAAAYFCLLTETYPPVSDNGDGDRDDRGAVAYEPPAPPPPPAAATDGPTVSGGPTAPEHDPFGGSGSPFGR